MQSNSTQNYIQEVLKNVPENWLRLTTHRLDIYEEKLAKVQFLEHFEALFQKENASASALQALPTAYDYIRLGHPLSCVLEWTIAKSLNINSAQVISFSSKTIPVLAVLRTNLLQDKKTRILYTEKLPEAFNVDIIKQVYNYQFELQQIDDLNVVTPFDGSTIYITEKENVLHFDLNEHIDFHINTHDALGSVILTHGAKNHDYIAAIQHVRRRESIAMTPANCLVALQTFVGEKSTTSLEDSHENNTKTVLQTITQITEADTIPLVASSGLSMQYAIMMGLIHDAQENHPEKAIKIVVPPNCYGGTNDQARRVAAAIDNVEVVDLPVDGDNDMVQSVHIVLDEIASQDAIPYIIAEIPTNPRVEVPDLEALRDALTKERKTTSGTVAVEPVFILDQTFCPNVHFLGENEILASVRTISYASGSKFPSGGLCTAGYCVGNKKAASLQEKIALHLALCDNEATMLQMEILAKQLPSMIERIHNAYLNTRAFVTHIQEVLPDAKINFVSEVLAAQGFTPSVFSLDLPTKGNSAEEREAYKRDLNHKLINLMITEIPNESKYCVSYGQLKGCYWTIPATSTQGTTKESDKDYIARVALSGNMDLELHKKVFSDFVEMI